MALKGTTKIELTNVKTGQKEVYEKNNLVTNAVGDILSMNPDGYLFQASYNVVNNMLPVCPNLIGGILLYEKTLEEDATKYYAPDDNPVIGYSSNDVNTGEDVKRGSMNQTESGPLDDGSGYRFVFDFATSQANGTISSLGLTSKWGGQAGYGSEVTSKDVAILLASNSLNWSGVTDYVNSDNAKYAHIVSIDPENNIAHFAYVTAANTITLGKIRVYFNKVGLVKNVGVSDGKILETTSIFTETFAARDPAYTYTARFYAMCDGGDGNIWFFEHGAGAEGNSSGDATINYVKISKEDWSFEEGSFAVGAQLYRLGYHLNGTPNQLGTGTINYAIVKDGFLYCINYTNTGIVKIDLGNPTNIKLMEHPNGKVQLAAQRSYYGSYGATEFNVLGNVIYFPNGHIVNDTIYPASGTYIGSTDAGVSDTSPKGLKGGCGSKLHYGPFLFSFERGSTYANEYIYLMTPYLATINNLATPVEKTADKTMKITYILREE